MTHPWVEWGDTTIPVKTSINGAILAGVVCAQWDLSLSVVVIILFGPMNT